MNTIDLQVENKIGTILFNRPQAMNALNLTMAQELLSAMKSLLENSDVQVIMLKGAGSSFMAGGDIHFFNENLDNLSGKVGNIIDLVHEFIKMITNSPKPVLACVHGSVAGVGLSFMLACDLVIAAQGCRFTTAYSKIGTTPDGGCSYFLSRIVGPKKAKELIMLSSVLHTEEAKQLGLINFVAPPRDLQLAAEGIARKIIKGPKLVYAKAKNLVNQSLENTLAQHLDLEKENFIKSTETEDFKMGVKAFIDKQKPEFKGV